MKTTEITAIFENENAPLYMKYVGQCMAQNAYVTVTGGSSEVHYDYDANIGNGISMDVFNGIAYRWRVPNELNISGIERLHTEIEPLLARVIAGIERSDNDYEKGKLNEDAQEACDDLENLLDQRGWDYDAETETDSDYIIITDCEVEYDLKIEVDGETVKITLDSENLYEGKSFEKSFKSVIPADLNEKGRVYEFVQECDGIDEPYFKCEKIADELEIELS